MVKMKLTQSITTAVGTAVTLASQAVDAKDVYAHFMVSGIDGTTDHAKQDITDAQNMGFDGFALNVNDPSADWATNCIDQLFAAAEGTGFKLFFSLDMNGNDDTSQFTSLFSYFDNDSYLKIGDDNKPFVSTFWGGALGQDAWKSLRDDNNLYFVPSFDDADGYYDSADDFFNSWGDVIDGAFNWETAWPTYGATNVSSDADSDFKDAADKLSKSFMMSMSPLQFKHCCGGNYYRTGEGNLPERMTQILDVQPERVEFITWNDAGESHYIGNVWEEAFTQNPEILEYSNNDDLSHNAWQPLMTSFINAYKDSKDASGMAPPSGDPIGAMWYHPVLKSCSSSTPDNADMVIDAVNFAFVLPSSLEGSTIRVTSGGNVISETTGTTGLNYGTIGGMGTGSQKVEIVNGGSTVATASSNIDVQDNGDGFCNFNYYVVELKADGTYSGATSKSEAATSTKSEPKTTSTTEPELTTTAKPETTTKTEASTTPEASTKSEASTKPQSSTKPEASAEPEPAHKPMPAHKPHRKGCKAKPHF